MPEAVWEGRPSAASFLGKYFLYSVPLWGQVAAIVVSGFFAMRGFPFDQISHVANALTGLSGAYGAVYLLGFLLALLVCIANWLVRVDLAPLMFTVASYLAVEGLRFLGVLSPDFHLRVTVLGLASALGVLGVEAYRRSFKYIIDSETVVIRGGIFGKWERVIRKSFVSDVVIIRPLLGYLFGYAHVIPVTQSQIGTGSTFSVGAVKAGKGGLEFLVGGGKEIRGVEARPWNCIFGVKGFERVKEHILE